MSDFIGYILHSNIINLLAVAVFLVWLVKKFNLVGIIDGKIEQIKSFVKNAEQEREQAIAELKEVKNKVKNISEEKKEITQEAHKTADMYREKIEAETVQSLQEIEKNTEKFLDAEQKSLKESISREVAQDALEIAKEHIKQAITDDMQKKYINDFIDSLDEMTV